MTDKLLTEAIKACFERVSESHGVGDGTLCNAESELAAILKRDEELEAEKQREFDIATGYYNGREKARRRIAEQEAQIAVMRETLLDIALCGDSLPMDATPDEHDAAIISMRDMASAALTPDTGKCVVDVAWLKEIEWCGLLLFYIDDVGGQASFACCPDCAGIRPLDEDEKTREYDLCKDQMGFREGHASDCKLDKLIGEGE